MTPGEFREVDFDLLADYLGDALDGTPERDLVARLVDENTAWRQAHDELSQALGAVRDDLADWGATSEPLPVEYAERIEAALAAAGPPSATGVALPVQHTPTRRLRVVPGAWPAPDDRRPAVGRRRRWSRLATPVVVAAAAVTAAGLGVGQLVGTGGLSDSASDSGTSAVAPKIAPEDSDAVPQIAVAGSGAPRAGRELSSERLRASGTDYTPGTLGELVVGLDGSIRSSYNGAQNKSPLSGEPLPSATGLDRLSEPATLTACLDAVAVEHAQGSVSIELVDYASFNGSPTLVIAFTDTAGQRWAWASGPACGLPGAGADTRYRTRVG